jgi:hypothetical protein
MGAKGFLPISFNLVLTKSHLLLSVSCFFLLGARLRHWNPDGSKGLPAKPARWHSSSMPHTAAQSASCLHAGKTLTNGHLLLLPLMLLLLLSSVFCQVLDYVTGILMGAKGFLPNLNAGTNQSPYAAAAAICCDLL